MDGKQKRGGNDDGGDDDNGTESDGDDSQLQNTAESGQNSKAGTAYYSDHINSVCAAMNNDVERSKSPFEMMMVKKRRETNRLSARRCRSRRRQEIQHLEVELRRLELETKSLIAEKSELQATLQNEVSKAKSMGDNIGGCGTRQPPIQEVRSNPQDNHAKLLQLSHFLQQQRSGQQHYTPTVDPSTASLARLMSAPLMGSFFDSRIAAAHHVGPSATAPMNPPSPDIFALLTMWQAAQGSAASFPTTNAQRVTPNAFTAPLTANQGSWPPTNTLLHNGPKTDETFESHSLASSQRTPHAKEQNAEHKK